MSETVIGLFNDLFEAVEAGAKEKLKQTIKSLQPLLESLDAKATAVLENYEYPLKNTNLTISCCKFGHLNILDYFLNNGKQFLDSLYNGTIANVGLLSPLDEDGEGHNAFYYAIRSNNVEIVELLLKKWLPSFVEGVPCKDSLLYKAYEELKLRNVRLTEQMDFFVVGELIAYCFNSNYDYGRVNSSRNDLIERIDWLLTNIESLKGVENEPTFLVLAKCVAQNMNILKRQLKPTYETLPWEELEFCVITCIDPRFRQQENSIFPFFVMTKDVLLSQLGYFAAILKNLRKDDLHCSNEFPNKSREEVVSKIINNSPEFILLYEIYEKARDLYSLEKIAGYLKLSLSVNPKEKQGKLSIIRVLQVLSDYLKITLDNCKLSDATSRIILSTLPKKIRNILSLVHSLEERVKIQEKNPAFFRDIQNDLKLLSNVVSRILNNEKVKVAVDLLEKVTKSDNVAEVNELTKSIKRVLNCIDVENFKWFEPEEITRLVSELKTAIPILGRSGRARQLIDDVITDLTDMAEDREFDHSLSLLADVRSTTLMRCFGKLMYCDRMLASRALGVFDKLNSFDKKMDAGEFGCFDKINSFDRKLDEGDLEVVKSTAEVALRILSPESYVADISKVLKSVEEIDETIKRKFHCPFHLSESEVERMNMLLIEISFAAAIQFEDVLCLDIAQECFDSAEISEQVLSEAERKTILRSKINILKNLIGDRVNSVHLKDNITLRLATEYLLLDILSISDDAECESENVSHEECYTPYLIGKNLKNYLAHGSELFDILLIDPATVIQSNAAQLINAETPIENRKIRDLLSNDVSESKEKLRKDMEIVTHQYKLFGALEEGDAETSLAMIKSGADIFGRSINNESSLHFATRGLNIDLAKLIVEQKVEVDSIDQKGRTPIHLAAAHGNMALIEYLVNNGTNVNMEQKDKNGRTCLHLAAQHGEIEVVKLLIKLGADLLALTDEKSRPPHHSTMDNGGVDADAEKLFEHGANIFGCGMIGRLSPLHIAAAYNRAEIIKVLLEKGVDVDIPNDLNSTPLMAAAENGSVGAAETLIRAGAKVNAYSAGCFTALHYAADKGHTVMAQVLLQNGAEADPANNLDTPIHFAALNGRVEIVKLLVQHKANPDRRNSWGCAPLHLAAGRGHANVIEALLASGVDVQSRDKRNNTALHFSAKKGFPGVTKLLIEEGAQLDAIGAGQSTALHFAADGGHEEVGEILVKKGANINVTDTDGFTPLLLAIRKKANSLVQMLLENGANLSKNDSDMTPLHLAAITGNYEAAKLLLKSGADVNCTFENGFSVLYTAVSNERLDIVQLLLEYGADVNANSEICFAPLYTAVSNERLDIVELLLEYGADVNANSDIGFAPLYAAVSNERLDIVELLLEHGADVNIGSNPPAFKAVNSNSKDILEILVKHQTVQKERLLCEAVDLGFADCVRVLLENGFPANAHSYEGGALHLAAARGSEIIVSDLLLHGANVNAVDSKKMTPMHHAVKGYHYKVVEVLLSGGANIHLETSYGRTALHFAAEFGDSRIIELLLAKGADPLAEDGQRETPLSLAIRRRNLKKVIAMLQSEKVDKNVRFWNNKTPLHLSAAFALNIVKYLVENNFFPDLANDEMKPIHEACIAGKRDIVKYFLDSGVSVNEPCSDNHTPLHYAADNSHEDVVTELLIHGGIYNALTNGGVTPLRLASNKNIKELLSLIDKCFELVEKGDETVESTIQNLGAHNVRHLKALIKTKNRNNQDIFQVADVYKYPRPNELFEICHTDYINIDSQGLSRRDLDEETFVKMKSELKEKQEWLASRNDPSASNVSQDINNVLLSLEKYESEVKSKQKECAKKTLLQRF